MKILIPDGHTGNVLAATRALGKAGHTVILGAPNDCRVWNSKYVETTVPITSPTTSITGYVNTVNKAPGDIVMPFGHDMTTATSLRKEDIEKPCPVPWYPRFEYGHDKERTLHRCRKLGIPIPMTGYPGPRSYPCIVKARKNCGIDKGLVYVNDKWELDEALREMESRESNELTDYRRPIVQEYVPGMIHDVVGMYQKGKRIAAVAQQRIETQPLKGGPGVYNKTIRDAKLIHYSTRLLDSLGWHGPYQTEWIKDERDGEYRLVELNPKMWGTMELSIRAGINMPAIAAKIAADEKVTPVTDYRVGVKKFWPMSVLENLRTTPSFRRMAMTVWLPEWIDFHDPRPSIWDMGSVAKQMVAK